MNNNTSLKKIAIFYDGNYFLHISNYYNFYHYRRQRVSISGLHDFIKAHIASLENIDPRYCRIVDTHYFRGRLSAYEAKNRNKLLSERMFDDILMREGVVTHYLPLGYRGEKGIDVWLALEAFELAMLKSFDFVVLIASDSDYVPLIRKLSNLGTKVMVLGWEFEYKDASDLNRSTVTSNYLMQEATYPILMHEIIDNPELEEAELIDNLFVPKESNVPYQNEEVRVNTDKPMTEPDALAEYGDRFSGEVQNLKDGFGFIQPQTPGPNLFFYWEDVMGDFNELIVGDVVQYSLGSNEKGECAVAVRKVESIQYQ